MLLTEIEKIENGRIFTKDEGLFECPHCKSTFAKNFAKDKMRRWGKDKQFFYNTKHCPNCDRRILMKDENKDALQHKIERLRQYANQCRITGDLEEYREALKEIANLEEEFKNLMKNLQIKDAAAVALDQIRKLKRSMAEDTALGALDSLKKEVKRNTKDQDNEKIEAYGVKGNSNTKWRRIFSNRTEMMKWVESNNAEIQGTRKAEPNERVGNVDKKTKDDSPVYRSGKYEVYEDGNEPKDSRFLVFVEGNHRAIAAVGSLNAAKEAIKRDKDVYGANKYNPYNTTKDKKMKDAALVALKGLDEVRKQMKDRKTKDDALISHYKGYMITTNGNKFQATNTVRQIDAFSKEELYRKVDDIEEKLAKMREINRRNADSKTKDTDRIEFDRLNDLIKEGRIEIDSWIGVNGNHGIAQVRGTSGKLSSLFVENIPDWFKKKYHIGDSKTKDESYTIQYKGWKINLVNRGANWEGEAFDNINMRKGMLSSEGLSSLSVQKDLQSQIDMQTQDSSKTKDINPPSDSERIKNDFESGRKDHNAGYYDKWYRWNRKDNGRAYDDGFNSVAGKPVQIIEAMHDSKTKDADLPVGKHNADPDDKFNAEELAMGIKIEMEHTDDLDIAKAIAKDHLNEVPDYYSRLTKMEEEAIEAEKVTKDEGNFLVGKRIIVNAGRFTNAPATVIEIGGQVTHGVNGVYAKMDTGEKVWIARPDFEFKDSKTKDASQAYIDGYTAARGAYHKGTNPIKNDPAKAAEWDRGWEDGKADKDELSAKGSGQEYIKYGSHFKDKKMKDGNGEQALDKCRHSLFPVANELATIASSSIYEDRIRKAAKRAERLVDEARHVLFDAV